MKIKKTHMLARIIAMSAVILMGIAVVGNCMRRLGVQERDQVEQTLQEATKQNVAMLQNAIQLRMKFLEAMASQMSDEEDPYYLVDQFIPLVKIYNARYIGYANLDGDAYLTNGVHLDVSRRRFFVASAEGGSCVSEVLMSEGGERLNVHSTPVWSVDGSQITGVMFVMYRTDVFNSILRIDAFDGRGRTSIIEAGGRIVSSYAEDFQAPGNNLFDGLLAASDGNAEAVEELRGRMEAGERAIVTVFIGEREYFCCVTPIQETPGGKPWFLTTVVGTEVLAERTQPMLDIMNDELTSLGALVVIFGFIIVGTEHSQRKELYSLAYSDLLTGMDNYASFCEKMRNGKDICGPGYVVAMDLRSFSTINNICGVTKGDELICATGRILTDQRTSGELAAHVSSDNFVMFLHSENQEALVERIRAIREQIIDLSPLLDLPHLVPQFGICAVETTDNPEQSYGDAGYCKQVLKERVDLYYSFFDDVIRQQSVEAQNLEDHFEEALAQRQFEVWYQPKYSPATGQLVAAEALVRWRRPDGVLVPPGRFIPLFEKNGMIAKLDGYIFDSVCAQQRAWMDEGYAIVPVSVNVSRVSLYFPNIAGHYMVTITRHGLPTDYVELEITESAIEDNEDIGKLIGLFRSCGFHILVDDFGSGYSSLATLTKNYFDNIKIDKSLIDCIGAPEGDSLLESIVQLAHKFNMTVTAEGVERASQADFLIVLACDNIQGYYYSRPLAASDFQALLTRTEEPLFTKNLDS